MAKNIRTVTVDRFLMRVNNAMTPNGFAVGHDKVKVRGGLMITRDWTEVTGDMFRSYQNREHALDPPYEFEFKIDEEV